PLDAPPFVLAREPRAQVPDVRRTLPHHRSLDRRHGARMIRSRPSIPARDARQLTAPRCAEQQRAAHWTLPWGSARLMLPGTESHLTAGPRRRHRGVGALDWP